LPPGRRRRTCTRRRGCEVVPVAAEIAPENEEPIERMTSDACEPGRTMTMIAATATIARATSVTLCTFPPFLV